MRRHGFTLMEMLLVTVLVSIVSLAVFQTFSNGLKLWAAGQRLDHEGDVAIWLDKVGEDVRGTLPVAGIAFKGSGMSMSFPSIIWTAADKNSGRAEEGVVDQIGAVEYRFDPAQGIMYRRQANYGQALKGQWQTDQEMALGLEKVLFHYYFSSDEGFVTKSQAEDKIPTGVTIEVFLRGDAGGPRLKRFFAIPVGG